MLFSVGDTGALLVGVVVVVVVVVVLDGAGLPLLPHAAVNAPSPMSTTPPTRAVHWRGRRNCNTRVLSVRWVWITCGVRQAVPSEQAPPSPVA
jgi:hypothetical protein